MAKKRQLGGEAPRSTGARSPASLSQPPSGICKVHKGGRSSGKPPPHPPSSCRAAAAVRPSTAARQPAVSACRTAAWHRGWWWPRWAGHRHPPAAVRWSPPSPLPEPPPTGYRQRGEQHPAVEGGWREITRFAPTP